MGLTRRAPTFDARLNVVELRGTPYELGLAHGRAQAPQIRAILRRYADLAGGDWQQLPGIHEAATQADVFFDQDDVNELSDALVVID